ncbi:DUF1761 domain-containing protein [Celeribacter sp.]|uniref:DUF1761 domain-containing protein n=1 Tax=Celeribacter sp. TaxID=1890673 RepID=UPI003A938EEF
MGLLSVILAALGGFFMGAAIYMSPLSKPWMKAVGIACDEDGKPQTAPTAMPFIVNGIALLIVAGMMRHVFAMAGIDGAGAGLIAGFGVGIFLIAPWIATNYTYAKRPLALILIDGLYAATGPAVMGLILGLF